jgi:hypothetical protein
MADQNLQYTVTFKTRSEGDGAQKTAAAVRDLRAEQERLNGLSTVASLSATEFAYYDLSAEIERTTAKTAAFAATTNTAAVGKKNFGAAIGQAGFQVQDFAVQVGAGQNAMIAFAQQGSQLLGMFGPYGAVAGALLAVGAIAYNVFSKMGDDVSSVLPVGDELKKLLDEIAKNAAAASSEEIDFALGALQAATAQAAELRNRWIETNTAADAYEANQLQNQEKIRQAFVEFKKLRGEQIDELAEIQAQETAAAQQRQMAAAQDAAAQRQKVADAAEVAKSAQQELVDTANLSAAKQAELAAERQKLELLREQRDALLEGIAAKGYFEITTQDLAALGAPRGTTATQAKDLARQRVESPEFQAQVAVVEARIAALETQLQINGNITNAVLGAAEKAAAASVTAADVAKAVDFETSRISEALQAETIKGKVGEAAKLATATAEEIKAALPELKAVTTEQKAAKDSLARLTADGQLTVNETAQALRDLQALFEGNSALVNKMITFMTNSQQKQREQDRKIEALLFNGMR